MKDAKKAGSGNRPGTRFDCSAAEQQAREG